jgi:hypothetical protein
LGRTAINQSSSSTARRAVARKEDATSVVEKRKKGKKERAALEKSKEESGARGVVEFVAKASTTTIDDSDDDQRHAGGSKKRKRRKKIRSRQKNIYKDTRDTKPDYLLPGNKNYQGRPLTEETRSKLHTGHPAKSTNETWKSNWREQQDTIRSDALPLAVDVVPTDGEGRTKNRASLPSSSNHTSGFKKRPNKYKNLQR